MHDRTRRIQIFYYLTVGVLFIFVGRLFWLQILNHSVYSEQAQATQLKQYQIPAERGGIYAYDGGEIVPVVLNENRYRIVADPTLVPTEFRSDIALGLSEVLSSPAQELEDQLAAQGSRYEVLATKQPKDIKEEIDALEMPGIFTNEIVPQRVYVQGTIAPQLLGFVNDAGEGNYGIEQAQNEVLSGIPGRVRALTDQNNIPLLASGDNILVDPQDGRDLVLTLDVSMQRQVEKLLQDGLKRAKSSSGSIIVMDSQSGAIRAMATSPTYDSAAFTEVEDSALYQNTAVSVPLEPGSVMKVLTVAAGLEEAVISPQQTYDDPGAYTVDGARIENVTAGAGVRSIEDILTLSLNTGATWLLTQLGGGELNERGRETWHTYLSERFFFGQPTGIEQGIAAEATGIVPSPTEGFGLNIKYANTAFGQGISVTPVQMIAAVNAVINGGTYYHPTLIQGSRSGQEDWGLQNPDVRHDTVVSSATANQIRSYMEAVITRNNPSAARGGHVVGGKTGTAQIANPEGGYFEDRFNGTYVGYVGGDTPEYTIFVRVDEPGIEGFAGSQAAGPIFSDVVNTLIDNFNVPRAGAGG